MGNAAREGIGETRSLTGRDGEDRATRRCEHDDGSGSRTAFGTTIRRGALDRPRGPLPTRVQDLDPLPAVFRDTVDDGLVRLGIALDPDAHSAIEAHARLLLAWTAAINLTAIREPAAVARLHVVDSLAAVPLLRAHGTRSLLDLGSGGGYPGIPLAAVLRVPTLLVESIGKKARFLETVRAAAGLAGLVEVATIRAEQLARSARHAGVHDAVTARAVASLDRLVELAMPLLAPGGILVAWKRGDIAAEVDGARVAAAAHGGRVEDVVTVPAAALPGHRLVVVRRLAVLTAAAGDGARLSGRCRRGDRVG